MVVARVSLTAYDSVYDVLLNKLETYYDCVLQFIFKTE